jgi:hypothetical protein
MRHDEEFGESFSLQIEEEDNKFDAKQFAHDKCVFDNQLLWRCKGILRRNLSFCCPWKYSVNLFLSYQSFFIKVIFKFIQK